MMDKMLRKCVWLSWVGGGLAIALSTLALVAPAARGQVSDPNTGFSNPDESRDAFSDNAQVGDMLDLIHQSNFSNSRSSEEIQLDRRNNIRDAAELFRQQQQERLQQQNLSQPNTAPNSAPVQP